MPRRHPDPIVDEPPRKKSFTIIDHDRVSIETGETLRDISGKLWKLGECIGLGGFGVIHEVIEDRNTNKQKYVVKIENHSSGPLFVEINCYLRLAREEMIEKWKKKKGLVSLGMPNYVASGSHQSKEDKYRFLILPRFKRDLEMILQEKKKFNLKTVLLIASQILYVLEYMHSNGYIHSDIKAANIMLDQVKIEKNVVKKEQLSNYSKSPISDTKSRYPKFRTCRVRKLTYSIRARKRIDYSEDSFLPNLTIFEKCLIGEKQKKEKSETKIDQLYLLDFGLASKYILSSGQHKICEDQRKAHAGTLLFCSRDAHKGIQSRRSDLESLAYNMVYWLTGSLPWIEDLDDPQMVQRKKMHCFSDISGFLHFCMNELPRVLKEIFQYIKNLNIQDTPDYNNCQQFIKKALRDHGYQDDGKFDFDNLEGWSLVKKKSTPLLVGNEFKRPPLLSNMPIKPVLRKKIKTKKDKASLYWSRMLSNPELLLKKVRERERKVAENTELPPLDLALDDLHPTPAMRDIYQRHLERKGKSPRDYQIEYSGDTPTGYTPEMATIWKKMMEQRSLLENVKSNGKRVAKKKESSRSVKSRNQSVKSKPKSINPVRTYSLRG